MIGLREGLGHPHDRKTAELVVPAHHGPEVLGLDDEATLLDEGLDLLSITLHEFHAASDDQEILLHLLSFSFFL